MKDPAASQAAATLAQGFALGELQVDPRAGEISGPGGRQQLDPKVMGVLMVLAEQPHQVVSREALLSRLWPNMVVTDDALTRCLSELRRQLSVAGGSETCRSMIETLPKRGYRLRSSVAPLPPAIPGSRPDKRRVSRMWGLVAMSAAIAVAVAIGVMAPERSQPSIAVLPFVDMSERQDQAYLADGIAEEILDKLNRSTDLRVIARTSSFVFRGQRADVAEIARKLGVTHVLEGSIRRSGDDLRVTAQLIAARDSSHIWSTTFQRQLGDIFAVQDEIAAAVAAALKTSLDESAPAGEPATNLAAYELVKQGEYLYYRRAPGDIERSIELFERAVQEDPRSSRAWADLAGAYSMQAWASDAPSVLLRAKQGDAALRAVELDPTLALAQARLAQHYYESGDTKRASIHLDRASQLDPDHPLVAGYMASQKADAGDLEGAIALQERALLRDPMNTVLRINLGALQIAGNRLDEALATYQAMIEINPDAGLDREVEIPRIFLLQGKHESAVEAALRLPEGKHRDQAVALLANVPGRRADADAALRRLEARASKAPSGPFEQAIADTVRLAEAHAVRGQEDRAFAALTGTLEALESHQDAAVLGWYLRYEAKLAPFLKPLRDDPRWNAFLENAA